MSKEIEIIRALEKELDSPQTKKAFAERIESFRKDSKNSIEVHIACMILAMLTANRPYEPIKQHVDDIKEIFFDYDPEKIKAANPETLTNEIKAIKCGNQRIKFQMAALKHNIEFLRSIEEKHGSIDDYYRTMDKYQLVSFLKSNIHEMGAPLISEYLPGVGLDLPKPDVHIKRILGSNRLGYSNKENATEKECFDIIRHFSEETGEYEKYIDYLLWSYCAEGEKNICGANPECNRCVIREYCNMNTNG